MKMIFIGKTQLKIGISVLGLALLCLLGNALWAPQVNETVADPIYQGNQEETKVALTINVDWGQEEIPKMLSILEEKGAKATFYITGRFGEKYPETVKAIYDAGHEIGNHGYSHPHPDQISVEANKKELLKTEQILTNITGYKTNLYAPPYGEKGINGLQAAEECGYQTILWTADTIDWQQPAPATATLLERVTGEKLGNGAIILMHPKPHTVEALPIIIDTIQEKGYELTTVSEVIK